LIPVIGCSGDSSAGDSSSAIENCEWASKAPVGSACSSKMGKCGECSDYPVQGLCGCWSASCDNGKLKRSDQRGTCPTHEAGQPEAGKDVNADVFDSGVIEDCQSARAAADGSACSIELGTCGECNDNPLWGLCGCWGVTCTDNKIAHFDNRFACPKHEAGTPEAGKDTSVDVLDE
jgi:hypothetical protein